MMTRTEQTWPDGMVIELDTDDPIVIKAEPVMVIDARAICADVPVLNIWDVYESMVTSWVHYLPTSRFEIYRDEQYWYIDQFTTSGLATDDKEPIYTYMFLPVQKGGAA